MKILLPLICSIACFYHANLSAKEYSNEPSIEQVITQNQDVFIKIDSLWLKTGGLLVQDGNSFVSINQQWLLLSDVLCYGNFEVSWKCTKCLRFSMDGINICPYCGKPKND